MISFIGAGKVGSALGLYFKQQGFSIGGYYNRSYDKAIEAGKITEAKAFKSISHLLDESEMIWITVSDDAIEEVSNLISETHIPSHIKAFVHASGVHSSLTLKKLQDKGFSTYSAHPLMAFGNISESVAQLSDVYFSIESGTKLLNEKMKEDDYLLNFLNKLGNKTLFIDTDKKELYHCAATVLSNYMVTLLNCSYEMFAEAGMDKDTIKKATAPLLNSTLKNIRENSEMRNALTGAIKRGDRQTVTKHLLTLSNFMSSKIDVYKELGKETMRMIDDYKLKDILE